MEIVRSTIAKVEKSIISYFKRRIKNFFRLVKENEFKDKVIFTKVVNGVHRINSEK